MELAECTKTGATISTKWGSVVMGCVVFTVLILLYFIYRYMKTVNKRFQSLEEIMGKVIEKNNQMQHLIQTTMRYPPVYPQNVQIPPTVPAAAQAPPIVPVPVPVVAPPNLDKEIMEELKELVPPVPPVPPVVPVVPVVAPVAPTTVIEEEEGRIEESA